MPKPSASGTKRKDGTTPECLTCSNSFNVKCRGGGSSGKYAYHCLKCDEQWQQDPPADLRDMFGNAIEPQREEIRRAMPGGEKRGRAKGGGYRCRKCGEKKNNGTGKPHVCMSTPNNSFKPNLSKQCSTVERKQSEELDLDFDIFSEFSDILSPT